MAALKLDMTIPLGTGGYVQLVIDITDVGALTPEQRTGTADTIGEFCAFAGATLAPCGIDAGIAGAAPEPSPPTIYDPNNDVLNGVTGSRIREKL